MRLLWPSYGCYLWIDGVERLYIDLHFSVLHCYPSTLHTVYPSPSTADRHKSVLPKPQRIPDEGKNAAGKEATFSSLHPTHCFFSLNKKNIKLPYPLSPLFHNFGRNKYSKCFRLEENIVAEMNSFASFWWSQESLSNTQYGSMFFTDVWCLQHLKGKQLCLYCCEVSKGKCLITQYQRRNAGCSLFGLWSTSGN